MLFSHNTAVRVLASAVTALLLCAIAIIHGSFWADFLVGMAAGVSIGLLCLVWSKQPNELDRRDDEKILELNLTR